MLDINTLSTYKKVSFLERIGFQEKQLEAIDKAIRYKYILYGGSAGGGKSFWLRWGTVYLLFRIYKKYGFKGVQAGIFCEDYVTLNDRQLSKIASEFPEWLGKMSNDCFTLADEFGGGKILFRNLDDTSKYRSSEFAIISVDELTMNYQQVFEDMRFRLRWVDYETKQELPYMECKFLGGTNPTGRGMAWVKKLWIQNDFSEYQKGMDEKEFYEFTQSFAFIQAKFSDNKYMSHYGKTLSTLEEKMRKALRDGSWDVFEGQFFPEFSSSTHTVNPYALSFQGNCFISLDYGYSAPSAVLFNYVDYDDNVIVYKEIYVTGHTPTMLAKAIFDATTHSERQAIQYLVADPSIWSRTGEKNGVPISNAELMQGKFNELGWAIGMTKADNDRVTGWGVVREHLNLENKPHVIIFNNCTNLIKNISGVVYAKNRQDDLDTTGEDHACFTKDALITFPLGKLLKQKSNGFKDVYEFMGSKVTADHPYLTQRGLVKLDSLRYSDRILLWNKLLLTELCLDDTQSRTSVKLETILYLLQKNLSAIKQNVFTGIYGKNTLVKYLKGFISITKTITHLITLWIISNVYHPCNTVKNTVKKIVTGVKSTLKKQYKEQVLGQRQKKESKEEQKLVKRTQNTFHGIQLKESVISVKNYMLPKRHLESSVTIIAKLKHLGKEEVFSMVTTNGFFLANGVVVSNCDALRYGLMSRPHNPKLTEDLDPVETATRLLIPTQEQIKSVLLDFDDTYFSDTLYGETQGELSTSDFT